MQVDAESTTSDSTIERSMMNSDASGEPNSDAAASPVPVVTSEPIPNGGSLDAPSLSTSDIERQGLPANRHNPWPSSHQGFGDRGLEHIIGVDDVNWNLDGDACMAWQEWDEDWNVDQQGQYLFDDGTGYQEPQPIRVPSRRWREEVSHLLRLLNKLSL